MIDRPLTFTPPAPLSADHDLSAFDSGEPVLDDWLKERALQNIELAASSTYVVCRAGTVEVAGFYALSMGQILNRDALGSMRRNMPGQIPAVLLGRLAIDRKWQGLGLGAALLKNAVERAARVAREVSARLMIVHAISPAAEQFYQHHGFARLPVETPTFALDLVRYRKTGALSG